MRRAIMGMLVLAAAAACSEREPRTSVLLLDTSRSVSPADRRIFLASLNAATCDLSEGDRLLLAGAGGGGMSEFRPLLDETVPHVAARLDRADRITEVRETVVRRTRGILAAGSVDRRTRLIEAIAAASEAFTGSGSAGRLVLLSDGVEDSALGKLTGRVTPGMVESVVAHARAEGLLPDLNGVDLHVVGAGGDDFAGVQSFWRAYARATGARLVSYGRLPLACPEGGERGSAGA